MKLSQSFVVVSLSMAAQTQIGLAAPMPNSPEPGSLHHARSPNPNSAQEEGSLNPIQDLLSRSLNRDDYSERHSRNGSPRHNYDGDGNGLLGVDVNFKRRESVERLERRGLDGLLSPILDITNGIPIAGPLVGSTVIQAEKTLVPVLGAVENLPIVGDVIKPLHLAQRDLLDLVKQLPIVGPVAAPLVTPVNDALSPIIKTVAGPLKSLPIVGDLLSSQKLIRRKITAQKEPAPLLSASIGLKKRENPYNSFNVDSQPLSRAGGAFPIEPSNSLDHLTLPNHIVQAEDHSHGEHPQSSAYDEQYPSATKPQSPNPAKLLRSTSGPTGTESLLDPLSSVSIASHLGTIPMLGSQITSQSSSIPMIRAQSGSNPLSTAQSVTSPLIVGIPEQYKILEQKDERKPKPVNLIKSSTLPTIMEMNEDEEQPTSASTQSENVEYENDAADPDPEKENSEEKLSRRAKLQKLFRRRLSFINQSTSKNSIRSLNLQKMFTKRNTE